MSDSHKVVKPGVVLLDRYEILERVARGGFAVVWRATDRLLGKEIALKVLHDAIADDEAAVLDLKQETLQSRQLTHEHIVQTYDFVQDGNVVAIAMEYIRGETLATLAARQPNHCFEPDDLGEWVAGICDALDYAHAKRGGKHSVVHHDVKPGNFMVDEYGTVKVLDFGISKTVSETKYQHTGQFAIAGTPPYMSPQQLRGQRPRPSDDIYSFGATLYALLTTRPPFYRGDVQLQIPTEVPPSMTERRQELELDAPPLPADWEEIVAACLAKESADRPGSMGEIAIRLGLRDPSSRSPATARSVAGGGTRVLGEPTANDADADTVEPETGRAPASAPRRGVGVAVGAVLVIGLGLAYSLGAMDPILGRNQGSEAPAASPDARDRASTTSANGSGDPAGDGTTRAGIPTHPESTGTHPDPNLADVGAGPQPATESATESDAVSWETLRADLESAVDVHDWDRASRLLAAAPTKGPSPAWWDEFSNTIRAGRDHDNKVSGLRLAVDRNIASGRWTQAREKADELLTLAPDDPAALEARGRISGELDRRSRIQSLRRDVQSALAAEQWEEADRLLTRLRPLAPGNEDVANWSSTVESERVRAGRIDDLAARIPRTMADNQWNEAANALAQLELHAPDHARIQEWRPVIAGQMGVRELLSRYADTQVALDAAAYRDLWLTLSDRDFETIRRSYSDMRSQQIEVGDVTVDLSGDTARVRFRENRAFDLRAGGHHETQTVAILTLRKTADGQWKISARSVER